MRDRFLNSLFFRCCCVLIEREIWNIWRPPQPVKDFKQSNIRFSFQFHIEFVSISARKNNNDISILPMGVLQPTFYYTLVHVLDIYHEHFIEISQIFNDRFSYFMKNHYYYHCRFWLSRKHEMRFFFNWNIQLKNVTC